MFTKSAEFYDAIYSWKDYAAEAAQLGILIEQNKRSPGKMLLDVACGTGHHLQYLNEAYQGEGMDLDGEMLKIARERCPGVTFYQGDMVNFDLGKQYDVVTCLFSSIGYAKTLERLNSALRAIARHLVSGGIAIIEPWLMPGEYIPKHVAARFVDLPDLKIARINTAQLEGDVSILAFEYLIGTPEGVEHLSERHELTLFSDIQYRAAFIAAGLTVALDTPGLDGHGLYVGVKS